MRGTGTFPDAFCALLLCTCRRWELATATVITAIEATGLLKPPDLDDLAESFLNDNVTVSYSMAWLSPDWWTPEWLKELADEVGMAKIADDATGTDHRAVGPPLRRWAASRALRESPSGWMNCSPPPMACRLGIATRWSVASSTPQAASTNRSGANWSGEACGQGRAPSGWLPWSGCASWTAWKRPAGALVPTMTPQ